MNQTTHNEKLTIIPAERAMMLINAMIDHMLNDACGHSKEVIARLLDLGFTKEELVDGFQFQASDVDECMETACQEGEVE